MAATSPKIIIPAHLSFLAVYSPALGPTNDTFHDQVLFWYSRVAKERRRHGKQDGDVERELQDEENEKLRQIGLAQGLVNFAKSFSDGRPVDSVETEKSRVVMHELEQGWWVLAVCSIALQLDRLGFTALQSITLTQIPVTNAQNGKSDANPPSATIEYSSREVSPPTLLLQQLLRAHSIFLLHNGNSLSDLYVRLSRSKFCGLLERFWNRFAANWDVLLHGNPAVDVYNGLKLAAGGELGIGVGEEEWGSGEREVLEDFARRTDGLMDLVVSRFGEPSAAQSVQPKKAPTGKVKSDSEELEPWMGAGRHAEAPDGVVFSGVGAISRSSVRDISNWMQWIYTYGEYAYGVRDDPSSDRRKRKRKPPAPSRSGDKPQHPNGKLDLRRQESAISRHDQLKPEITHPTQPSHPHRPGIPPPIVSAVERSLERATSAADIKRQLENKETERSQSSSGATEKWMKYLTLGYGSAWGSTANKAEETSKENAEEDQKDALEATGDEASMRQLEPEPYIDNYEELLKAQIQQEDNGHFIVGLKGSLEDDPEEEEVPPDRILLRTLYVGLLPKSQRPTSAQTTSHEPSTSEVEDDDENGDDGAPTLDPTKPKIMKPYNMAKTTRLRVIVYVHRPFIYTFLFQPRTESLAHASFYRDLHTYLSPLHRPLSASTSPSKFAARVAAASGSFTSTTTSQSEPSKTEAEPSKQISALVFDPATLTLHSSLPNIPIPGSLAAEGLFPSGVAAPTPYPQGWSRAEAFNVHSSVLDIHACTRGHGDEAERCVKTGRGWWVVWMRLGASAEEGGFDDAAKSAVEVFPAFGCGEEGEGEAESARDKGAGGPLVSDEREGEADAERDERTVCREAILVRHARDAASSLGSRPGGMRIASGFFSFGSGAGSNSGKDVNSGWGPKGLAEGVGVDARRYVEGLLSLSR